eukprot:CAMPEP_0204288004 /NCGR_PEP_ID=MMETSP0468-20130131/55837_1 /ASSEMBLY_ACC=CAM_ASM_000383 /TAXON_ID=2969 /ORGANISM="Oxyrrhis marina" /LENGTH=145 /DNA_ID=CAMNT_0051266049 /DNA_START=106 /DNA_END=540 /DNA_ORIENTATION=-
MNGDCVGHAKENSTAGDGVALQTSLRTPTLLLFAPTAATSRSAAAASAEYLGPPGPGSGRGTSRGGSPSPSESSSSSRSKVTARTITAAAVSLAHLETDRLTSSTGEGLAWNTGVPESAGPASGGVAERAAPHSAPTTGGWPASS